MNKRHDFEIVKIRIMKHLMEKKTLHYIELADILKVAPSTAYGYIRLFAERYKDKVKFHRGAILLVKDFEEDEQPIELKYEHMRKSLESYQKLKKEREEKLKKIQKNHLTHMERAILEGDIKKADEELQKLKKKIEEILKGRVDEDL